MREIVLDTETTGFKAREGDRLVELGCVELVNHIATGRTFHVYINPERDMPDDAFRVHGLSTEFLRDKPLFTDIADSFLDFIGDDKLVIHNAGFDMSFLNMELERSGRAILQDHRAIDTLMMARRKFPGASATLDALCSRFGIDNTRRTKHGALLDSELLAEVYLELIGGRQQTLGLGQDMPSARRRNEGEAAPLIKTLKVRPNPLPSRLSAEDEARHRTFIAQMSEKAIWNRYS